jgi:hypothetical protein
MKIAARISACTSSLAACALAAMLVQACGASPPPPAAAPPPAAEAVETGPVPASASPATVASPPPATPSPPPPAAPVAPETMTSEVGATLKRAEHDIATGDCPTACRALGSMEHAVSFLCAANPSGDDADRCDNAKHHLKNARRHVRANCGGCPGGPSVEVDAPIPSTK